MAWDETEEGAAAEKRNWCYGASRPIEGAERLPDVFRLQTRYYNSLIELDRFIQQWRDEAVSQIARGVFSLHNHAAGIQVEEQVDTLIPEFQDALDAEASLEALDDLLANLEVTLKQRNQQARRKNADPELAELLATTRSERKWANGRLRAAEAVVNRVLRGSPELTMITGPLTATDPLRTFRAGLWSSVRRDSGLWWCNSEVVDAAESRAVMDARRNGELPRFRRNRPGEGTIQVQIQGGISAEEALAGTSRWLRILPYTPPPPVEREGRHIDRPNPTSRRQNPTPLGRRAVVWMWQGFEDPGEGEEGKGDRLWCKVPIFFHRPLPEGCRIQRCYLDVYRVGTHTHYQVRFIIRRAVLPVPAAPHRMVGVDIGWRIREDGIRVAAWEGTDGRTDELIIPHDRIERHWERPAAMRSQRDRDFDTIRAQLLLWLVNPPVQNILPEWLRERLQHLSQWKSQARLASVVLAWRANPFHGGETMYDHLEEWRRRDKHLYNRECGSRARGVRWRDDLYRNWVARLRKEYGHAAIEDIDWSQIARRAVPENERYTPEGVRYIRQAVAPGRLAALIREGFGTRHLEVKAEFTTTDCQVCGSRQQWDKARELFHRCTECRSLWDQDFNAAHNILTRGLDADG